LWKFSRNIKTLKKFSIAHNVHCDFVIILQLISAYLACTPHQPKIDLGGQKDVLINFQNHLDVTEDYFCRNVFLHFKIIKLYKIHFIQEQIFTNYPDKPYFLTSMPLERLKLPQEMLWEPNQMHCLHASRMMWRKESMKNDEALTCKTWQHDRSCHVYQKR